ncbi:MAG: exodeoxyribonuclease VII large subunit [Planctomycetes bacterium]|nr:exodeoxyribonuclease VII large subunit [Planctomycetota bacterium]
MAGEKIKSVIIKKLSAWRDAQAAKTGVENYKILQYQTIEAIAAVRPETLAELADIKGIGPKKLNQFGRTILELIQEENGGAKSLPVGQEYKKLETSLHRQIRSRKSDDHGQLFRVDDNLFRDGENKEVKDEEVLTVSEYLDRINDCLAPEFADRTVRGEISGLSDHPSGVYFALKDQEDESVLNCYLPPGIYAGLGFRLEDGMEIKARGEPSVWKPKGKFSLRIAALELAGEGSLKKAYEFLRAKLEQEGLFARKRPLPEFVRRIGVITSRAGAVIHDFRQNLAKLGFQAALYDVRVEGAKAAGEIASALKWFNAQAANFEILVIMRGGGSLEDLQAFNNEIVAREIFASRLPTVAAIGHDRDIPIAALVADQAVSTPTAAAVLVNGAWQRLKDELPRAETDLKQAFSASLADRKGALEHLSHRLANYLRALAFSYQDLYNRLEQGWRLVGEIIKQAGAAVTQAAARLGRDFEISIARDRERIGAAEKFLSGASPERTLALGYSIVTNQAGRVVKSAADLRRGEKIRAKLHQGGFEAVVEEITK